MSHAQLADLVVAFHVVYVAFVVGGEALILLGGLLRWGWVRNLWFRIIHVSAIVFVAAEAVIGMTCPLTDWENQLRRLAGEAVEEGTFIGRCLHRLIFYQFEPWALTALHIGFALLVLATLYLVPPRIRACSASKGS
jgi:hypothetical protein